jgi:hypothetical protein
MCTTVPMPAHFRPDFPTRTVSVADRADQSGPMSFLCLFENVCATGLFTLIASQRRNSVGLLPAKKISRQKPPRNAALP